MSYKVPGLSITRQSSAAIAQDVLVKLDTNGKVAVCGADEFPIGITLNKTSAANENQAVGLHAGCYNLTLSGAVTAGDFVASAAAGAVKKLRQDTFTYTVNSTTDVVTATGHTFVNGDLVTVLSIGGIVATPLQPRNQYYVGAVSGDTFNLYDTSVNALAGGATGKIDFTGIGSGVQRMSVATTYARVGIALETGVDGQIIGVMFDPAFSRQ